MFKKTFGCCRLVYNLLLCYHEELYSQSKLHASKFDLDNYCNQVLKPKYIYLKEVDSRALKSVATDVITAFDKFFKHDNKYPKYKSKHNRNQSYTTNANIKVDFDNNTIKIPKISPIKTKIDRHFNGKIKSATVSYTKSGKYYISILVEESDNKYYLQPSSNYIGIDLGIKTLLTLSNGIQYKNLKLIKKYESRIKKYQRSLSRKQYNSNNYIKQKHKIARLYDRITDARKDYINKITTQIIKENQIIICEDLRVKNMLKNHTLAKSISDADFNEITRQLKYKSKWYNRTYYEINTFYPSSQICSVCGHNSGKKDLSVRKWTCPKCNNIHDRDINAANNILKKGLFDLNIIP